MDNTTFGGSIGRTTAESTPWWPEPVAPRRGSPNVVYVVFDDVGFSDFGCYGSEIETPNINRLAAHGLRYTSFHTTALCSPTRACLLTGRNHHSVGMGGLANWDMGFPGNRGHVAKSAGNLAEILRLHGYNTYAVGKWHLTPMDETSAAGPYDQWPTQRGFDRYYGFLEGMANQWRPALTYDNHHIEPPDRPGYHLTEDVVDRSIEFIRDQKSVAPQRPFFLYMCFGACHSPHHAPREYVDKYVPVFEKGWDRTREDRLARQKAMGIVPPGTEMPARNEAVRAWDELSADEQRLAVRLQAAYAGMLDHADHHLGRLLAFLEEIREDENTLLFLVSDNGASQEGSPVGTVDQMRWFNGVRDDVATNLAHIDEIGEAQLLNNYPLGWAMAGNTPLKRYKQNTHGGGIRDPLIVHWPAGIRDVGGVRNQFCHASDVTPTVLEVLGIEPPAEINGVSQQPIEGTSIAYSFGEPASPTRKETQYFEMIGHRGIWHRGWKAVAFHRATTPYEADQWELYHLDQDFSEYHDLAAEQPERLREMVERWWVEAGKYRVLPLRSGAGVWRTGKRNHTTGQSRWVLYPHSAHIPTAAAPDTRNRSYSVTAEVEIPAGGAQGVLIAHGDAWSGWTMYVKDGHLVHEYNFAGTRYVLRSGEPVAAGPGALRYTFTKTADHAGRGALFINGEAAGEADLPRTLRSIVGHDGIEVGRNAIMPVGGYESPFAFTGTIKRVVVELEDDGTIDRAATLAQEMARQ